MNEKITQRCSIQNGEESIRLHDKDFDVNELLKEENIDLLKESNIPIYKLLASKYSFLSEGYTRLLLEIFDVTDLTADNAEKFIMQFPFMNKDDMDFKFDILLNKSLAMFNDPLGSYRLRYVDIIESYYRHNLSIDDISSKYGFETRQMEIIISHCVKLLRIHKHILFRCDSIINIWADKKDWYQRGILFRNHIDSIEDLIEYKSKLKDEDEIKEIECLIYDIVSYEHNVLEAVINGTSYLVMKKENEDKKIKREEKIRKIPLASLKLSRKTFDLLLCNDCTTVGDIYDLLSKNNVTFDSKIYGKSSIKEIARLLDKMYATNKFRHYYFYDNIEPGVYKEPILKSENERRLNQRIYYLENKRYDNKYLRLEIERLKKICIRYESEIDALNKKLDDLEYIKSVFERLEPIEQNGKTATFELELYNDERIVFHDK